MEKQGHTSWGYKLDSDQQTKWAAGIRRKMNVQNVVSTQNFELVFSLDRIAEFDIVGPYKMFVSIMDKNETFE